MRFSTPRIQVRKKRSNAGQDALKRLNDFLDSAEAGPVSFLSHLWEDQQQAITYRELRDAILNGYMDEKTLTAWEKDYSKVVKEKFEPVWQEAMRAANDELEARFPAFFFNPSGTQNWIVQHGAQWVTIVGQEQREAIAAMIMHGAGGAWDIDELSRMIRPCIGLNRPQAIANLRYYQHVKQSLLANNQNMRVATAAKRAKEAAVKYAERQHRGRAYMIARTELAFAYNKGAHEGVKQAQAQGYLGRMVKRWSAAGADACPICAALEGVVIGMDDGFDFGGRLLYAEQRETPPAHPNCRCAVMYEEVEPPVHQQDTPAGLNSDLEVIAQPETQITYPAKPIVEQLAIRPVLPITPGYNDFGIFPEERQWRGSKIEQAALYDTKGDVIIESIGTENEVGFPNVPDSVFLGVVMSHWHPKPFPPSPKDFYQLKQKKMHSIRTVTERGIYVLRQPDIWAEYNLNTLKDFRSFYSKISEDIFEKIFVRYEAGELTQDEADELGQLQVVKKMTELLGVPFYLIPWEGL